MPAPLPEGRIQIRRVLQRGQPLYKLFKARLTKYLRPEQLSVGGGEKYPLRLKPRPREIAGHGGWVGGGVKGGKNPLLFVFF